MKARETEGERGIGQYVNEGGEMKYRARGEAALERKTKRSHALPVEMSLTNTFQFLCACLCVWWVTLGMMALYPCVCVI